jgi:hypothetical protein
MGGTIFYLVWQILHITHRRVRQVRLSMNSSWTVMPTSDRVFDLKAALHNLTKVPPERQKILGLVKGRLPPDQGRM